MVDVDPDRFVHILGGLAHLPLHELLLRVVRRCRQVALHRSEVQVALRLSLLERRCGP